MALREVDPPAGAPWERPLTGSFDRIVVESDLLTDNPLGDPSRRPLYIYRARDVQPKAPAIFMLQGYSGQLDMWMARKAFEPTSVERIDAMFTAGGCLPATVVFLDAWTSIGGAQFLNSSATGRYLDYICDEVVPFVSARYETGAAGVAGHSSGGYGAMVRAMLRPDVFSAFASLAGDALFECCYQPEFPLVARTLRDHFDGSFELMLERVKASDPFDFALFGSALSAYAMAAAYSPDPDHPGKVLLPFSITDARLIPDIWEQWLQRDPVRMVPHHADALRAMKRIYLDAGRQDEYFLDLGAEAVASELAKLDIPHTLELFDGRHGPAGPRYPGVVRELVLALAT
jgi:pimeloyl-ACP methyl ester carboxylesterase